MFLIPPIILLQNVPFVEPLVKDVQEITAKSDGVGMLLSFAFAMVFIAFMAIAILYKNEKKASRDAIQREIEGRKEMRKEIKGISERMVRIETKLEIENGN